MLESYPMFSKALMNKTLHYIRFIIYFHFFFFLFSFYVFLSNIFFFVFRSTMHCKLPKPIETQMPKLLAFIDSNLCLAYFSLSPVAHTMNEIFFPLSSFLLLLSPPFSHATKAEKTGEIKFTSIGDSLKLRENCDEKRRKTFERSFTYTNKRKLFIGCDASLRFIDPNYCDVSRWVKNFRLKLSLLLLLSIDVVFVGPSLALCWKTSTSIFSLMKNRKR